MPTDHNFWRERRAETDSNRSPSALPLGQTGSQQKRLHITRDNLIMQLNTQYTWTFPLQTMTSPPQYIFTLVFFFFACLSTQFPAYFCSAELFYFLFDLNVLTLAPCYRDFMTPPGSRTTWPWHFLLPSTCDPVLVENYSFWIDLAPRSTVTTRAHAYFPVWMTPILLISQVSWATTYWRYSPIKGDALMSNRTRANIDLE